MTEKQSVVGTENKWAAQWALSTGSSFGPGIAMLPSGGLAISSGASTDDIKAAAATLWNAESKMESMSVMLRFALGDSIIELASRGQKTFEEVISEEGFCKKLGLAMRTMLKWPHVARMTPEESRFPELSWSHYVASVSFKGPDPNKKPLQAIEFNTSRLAIIEKAAEDPENRGKQWISSELRSLQKRSGVKQTQAANQTALLEWGAQIIYLYQNATEEQLAGMGKERRDVADALQEFETELINRGLIAPESLTWPQSPTPDSKPVVEVESNNENLASSAP